jgi:hypothetical protein
MLLLLEIVEAFHLLRSLLVRLLSEQVVADLSQVLNHRF